MNAWICTASLPYVIMVWCFIMLVDTSLWLVNQLFGAGIIFLILAHAVYKV